VKDTTRFQGTKDMGLVQENCHSTVRTSDHAEKRKGGSVGAGRREADSDVERGFKKVLLLSGPRVKETVYWY